MWDVVTSEPNKKKSDILPPKLGQLIHWQFQISQTISKIFGLPFLRLFARSLVALFLLSSSATLLITLVCTKVCLAFCSMLLIQLSTKLWTFTWQKGVEIDFTSFGIYRFESSIRFSFCCFRSKRCLRESKGSLASRLPRVELTKRGKTRKWLLNPSLSSIGWTTPHQISIDECSTSSNIHREP